jgi:predicted RNA-binding Zn-ribbon protein involved in translation (DUF1610 family)
MRKLFGCNGLQPILQVMSPETGVVVVCGGDVVFCLEDVVARQCGLCGETALRRCEQGYERRGEWGGGMEEAPSWV